MPTLAGFLYDSSGAAVNAATVNVYARNTTTPVVATTTTNASGYWQTAGVAEGRYDVEIVSGTTTIRMKYDDEIQVERLEAKTLQVRGSDNAFAYTLAGGAIAAARTLNLPVITGADTIAVLGLAQAFTAAKQFTTIELGHASDTTLARDSAGVVSIEGNVIYRAGGTDVVVADGGTGVSSLTAYAVLTGGTTSTGPVQSIASVGTSGQVLTSNGAGALPTFQDAAAPKRSVTYATVFETAGRFTATATGGGTATFNTEGLNIETSATGTSSEDVRLPGTVSGTSVLTTESASFGTRVIAQTAGTDYDLFVGVGNLTVNGSSITFTGQHFGFRRQQTASGGHVVSATNGNGSTQTETTGIAAWVNNEAAAVRNGTTNIKFYVGRTLVATHTTNLPTDTAEWAMQACVTNKATATNSKYSIYSYQLEVDAEA